MLFLFRLCSWFISIRINLLGVDGLFYIYKGLGRGELVPYSDLRLAFSAFA